MSIEMAATVFKNARLITPGGIVPGSLLVEGSHIAGIAYGDTPDVPGACVVDAKGAYLSPGFIDVHTHGAGGCDFMDGSLESIYTACRAHLLHGTTSIVPTTVTGTRESLLEFVELFNQVEECRPGMPHILGLHLEGPYFAYEQRGAQDPRYLRPPQPAEYEAVLEKTNRVVRWSFAVELEGGDAFLDFLNRHGIVSSLAHSNANCAQVIHAHRLGLSALTHFYSCMTGVTRVNAYRVAGAVEAGYLLDDLTVEVIADGKHLPSELLRLIYKIKGADHICLVTDSMRAAGMPEGEYKLGGSKAGLDVIVEEGVAKLPDRTAFAGSVATADRLVHTMRDLGGVPLHEAVTMMSLTPARLLHVENSKGSLEEGKDADLLLFDEDINIQMIMSRGTIISD